MKCKNIVKLYGKILHYSEWLNQFKHILLNNYEYLYNECTKLRMYDVNDKQRIVSASSRLESLILLLNTQAKITIVV